LNTAHHAGGKLAEGVHLLRAAKLVLKLFTRGDVHQGADEPDRLCLFIAENTGPLQEKDINSVRATEPVFAAPVFACAKRVAAAGGGARAIFRVNVFLPETDFLRSGRKGVTEEALQALRPGQPAALYIPIPKRIIRSPGSKRRMFRAFSRSVFERMVWNLMGLAPPFAGSRFSGEGTGRGLVFILNFGC